MHLVQCLRNFCNVTFEKFAFFFFFLGLTGIDFIPSFEAGSSTSVIWLFLSPPGNQCCHVPCIFPQSLAGHHHATPEAPKRGLSSGCCSATTTSLGDGVCAWPITGLCAAEQRLPQQGPSTQDHSAGIRMGILCLL